MTITFQPNMLEDPKFKALITNKEMLSISDQEKSEIIDQAIWRMALG